MNLPESIYNIKNVTIHKDVNLSKFTTIRLKNIGSIAIVESTDSLVLLLSELNGHKIQYHLVGWGANQIIHNSDDTLFVNLKFEFDRSYLEEVRNEYRLPASVPLNMLTSHAQKFGLKGWEVFTGIPASLGGAIFMNAGTGLGEIGELVKEVTLLKRSGELKVLSRGEIEFSYRKNHFVEDGDVIIEAVLTHKGVDKEISNHIKEYLEYRKKTQPITTKNCGCVFKNFDTNHRAGHYIELVGLKGLSLNGLQVSNVHANFIENKETYASSDDFVKLVNLLQSELELQTGIKFELEAKVY
jgi:UDP-N-acetylmuramate dehydrogenase